MKMVFGSLSRILSRSYSNLYPRSQPQAYRLATFRHESSETPLPDNPAEKSLAALEDAVHSIVVKRAAPAWLPFRPGMSYWAPPRTPGGIGGLVNRLSDSLTPEELRALSSLVDEPSSLVDYFITPNVSTESEDTSASDEEEEEEEEEEEQG